MIDQPALQGGWNGFPVGHGKFSRRKVGRVHASAAPLFDLLLITPAVVRTISAPAIEHAIAARGPHGSVVNIDSQTVDHDVARLIAIDFTIHSAFPSSGL